MSNEGFLRRWSRLKTSGGEAEPVTAAAPAPAPAPAAPVAPAEPAPARREDGAAPSRPSLPTLEDAARLTPDADFSAFVARGVDKSVQRLALKKLFADPHFNAIDGLDIYMSDYNKASPLSPEMLASLKHAPGVLARLLGDRQDADAGAAEAAEAAEAPAVEAAAADALAGAPGPDAGPAPEYQYDTMQPSTQQGNA